MAKMTRYEDILRLPESTPLSNESAQKVIDRRRGELLAVALAGRWSIYEPHADVIAMPFDLTLSEIWHTAYMVTLRIDVIESVEADLEWGDVGRCDWCEELRPVRLVPDPYTTEIFPEADATPLWFCEKCWTSRRDDI